MCLAIYKKKGVSINKTLIDNIKTAWSGNSDGAGYSIKLNEGIYTKKGIMTLDELLNDLKLIGTNEAVIHLRYATSGEIDEGMTHPFNIDSGVDNKKLKETEFMSNRIMAHNGVLFSPIFDDYSDTAILSRMIARANVERLGAILDNKKLIDIMGSDRLCFMGHGEETILIGQWHEIDGVSYSNLYTLKDDSGLKWGNSWDDLDDKECQCIDCKSYDLELVGMHYDVFTCLSCGSIFNDKGFRFY